MKCKHHKKHYDEKRSAHLRNIQALEANLESKEQELQVGQTEIQREAEMFITGLHGSFKKEMELQDEEFLIILFSCFFKPEGRACLLSVDVIV